MNAYQELFTKTSAGFEDGDVAVASDRQMRVEPDVIESRFADFVHEGEVCSRNLEQFRSDGGQLVRMEHGGKVFLPGKFFEVLPSSSLVLVNMVDPADPSGIGAEREQHGLLVDELQVGAFDMLRTSGYNRRVHQPVDLERRGRYGDGYTVETLLGQRSVGVTSSYCTTMRAARESSWEVMQSRVRWLNRLGDLFDGFRWDLLKINRLNDCMHTGYPICDGRGTSPYGFQGYNGGRPSQFRNGFSDVTIRLNRLTCQKPNKTCRCTLCQFADRGLVSGC